MNVAKYEHFIPQNTAPKNAKRIALFDVRGNKVGTFGLQNIALPTPGDKQYSFGAISDVHLQYNTALEDFQRALAFLHDTEKVDFTCVCGDLTDNGEISDLTEYKNAVGGYPVYEITGNHDGYTLGANVEMQIETYTGNPLYYSFTKGEDVFIMVGIVDEGKHFTDAELQWLYEVLETNRNKRCFVFQHIFPSYGTTPTCGNAYGIYANSCWNPVNTGEWIYKPSHDVFENLMKHYKNVVFFHGHSHLEFALQSKECQYANYSDADGYKSVHIPALSILRSGDSSGADSRYDIADGSQGYVVDVYENGIHLRGRDFAKGEFLPIASYWLDTTLVTIPAGTYTDTTGTITT